MEINLTDVKVHVEEYGEGEPLLLLHGWGLDATCWLPIIPELANSFHVYTVDLPGFGSSSVPPTTFGVEDYARTIQEICDQLHIEHVSLLGHSFGGNVAWVYTALHPENVEKLVLVDASGIRITSTKTNLVRILARSGKTATSLPLLDTLQPKLKQLLYKNIDAHDYANAGPLKEIFKKIISEQKTDLLARITCSTLLIWGENDAETPLNDAYIYRSSLSNARLVVFADVGHFPFQDRKKEFTSILLHYLKT